MEIIPSKYQKAIYHAFEHSRDSLLVEAVAGSGKTTVLVELSRIMERAMPQARGAFLAFNKSIAMELQARVTARNVGCMTLHSAGWCAWRRGLGMDSNLCSVDSMKTSKIMREVLTWDENRKWGDTTRKLVGYAKGVGLVPKADFMEFQFKREVGEYHGLVQDWDETWQGLIDHYGLDEDECNIDVVRRVLARGIELARETCDFDDMLYMPVIAGVPFDRYNVVLVDEAQDLSGIQHEIISRMVEAKSRVIAVGDRKQAIYSWRGAHADSMDRLKERFGMRELPLSVSYRCPVSVVQHARQWVPQIEWKPAQYEFECRACEAAYISESPRAECPECGNEDVLRTGMQEGAPWGYVGGEGTNWAIQTEMAIGAPASTNEKLIQEKLGIPLWAATFAVSTHMPEGISKWKSLADFHPGDAILCRLTRPLVEAAFTLIRGKVACRVLGRDIGKGLVDLVKKSKQAYVVDFLDWLSGWEQKERLKFLKRQEFARIGLMSDRCETVRVFCAELPDDASTGELTREIERLFVDGNGEMQGMVTLSTVHKAKGMEWERVFVLDAGETLPCKWARSGWELEQEKNLAYVAATRAKRELRYITSEDLRGQ